MSIVNFDNFFENLIHMSYIAYWSKSKYKKSEKI